MPRASFANLEVDDTVSLWVEGLAMTVWVLTISAHKSFLGD